MSSLSTLPAHLKYISAAGFLSSTTVPSYKVCSLPLRVHHCLILHSPTKELVCPRKPFLPSRSPDRPVVVALPRSISTHRLFRIFSGISQLLIACLALSCIFSTQHPVVYRSCCPYFQTTSIKRSYSSFIILKCALESIGFGGRTVIACGPPLRHGVPVSFSTFAA